jgi:predicted house-cleaning noncanonical NTP pyrophosphatase (MazG superfamily)
MEKVYNKLVRDKIPDIILADGREPVTRILDDLEYKKALEIKLEEEKEEVLCASGKDRIEELSDMLEVMISLAKIEGYNLEDIIECGNIKREKRGSFERRIFLEKEINK